MIFCLYASILIWASLFSSIKSRSSHLFHCYPEKTPTSIGMSAYVLQIRAKGVSPIGVPAMVLWSHNTSGNFSSQTHFCYLDFSWWSEAKSDSPTQPIHWLVDSAGMNIDFLFPALNKSLRSSYCRIVCCCQWLLSSITQSGKWCSSIWISWHLYW